MKITIDIYGNSHADARVLAALAAAMLAQPDQEGVFLANGSSISQYPKDEGPGENTDLPAGYASTLASAVATTGTAAPIPGPGSFESDDSDVVDLGAASRAVLADDDAENGSTPSVATNAEVDNWGVQFNPAIHSSNHNIYTDGKHKGRFHRRKNVPVEQYDAVYADRRNGGSAVSAAPIPGPGTATDSAPVFTGTGQSPGYIPPANAASTHVPAGPGVSAAPAPAVAPTGAMDFNGFVSFVTSLMNRKPNPFPGAEVNTIIAAMGYKMLPDLAQPSMSDPNLIPNIVMQIQLRDATLFPRVG